MELRNPKKDPEGTGRLIIKALKSGADEEANHIRLDAGSRNLLRVNAGDEVIVRKSVLPKTKKGFLEKFLEKLVGVRELQLIVIKGEDIDEGKSIVRCCEDVLPVLGIKEGEFLRINWADRYLTAKVLKINKSSRYITEYMRKIAGQPRNLPLVIQIGIFERTHLSVDLYDVVTVRRDPFKTLLLHLDRLIISVASTIGIYLSATQAGFHPLSSIPLSLDLGLLITWIFFARVRSGV